MNGCPWNEETCAAALSGNLECIVYAHEHGCPWDENTRINAQENDDCIEYVQENGCP